MYNSSELGIKFLYSTKQNKLGVELKCTIINLFLYLKNKHLSVSTSMKFTTAGYLK